MVMSREVMQMLSNLEAAGEAIKIFNERNNIKLPDNITEPQTLIEIKLSLQPESAEETFS